MMKDKRRQPARSVRQVLMAAPLAAPLLGAAPALAQWFDDSRIPPKAIGRIVMRHGYIGFSLPRLAGDVYIVHAVAAGGDRVRLVVDAYDGRIIIRPVGAEPFTHARPAVRVRPREDSFLPDFDDDDDDDDDERGAERERENRRALRRMSRDDLVPPRSIGRPRDIGSSPDSEEEVRREYVAPYAPPVGRDDPSSKTARAEQPIAPTAPSRRGPERPTRATPAALAPVVEAPKSERYPAKPTATAAAPAASAAKKAAPATPATPVIEAPKPDQEAATEPATTAAVPAHDGPIPAAPGPETSNEDPAAAAKANKTAATGSVAQPSASPPAAAQPAATASPASNVRVIEGVTPILPRNPAAVAGSSSEPATVTQ